MSLNIKSVLIVDDVDGRCADILIAHGLSVSTHPNIKHTELFNKVHRYDALIVGSKTQVTKQILAAGLRLKAVGTAGTDTDNIDVRAAEALKIAVITAPGCTANSVCELTFGLALAMARHIVPTSTALKVGLWEQDIFKGSELHGKIIAVIGLGRVGREVASRMLAFGMKVVSYDPRTPDTFGTKYGIRMELKNIWPIADYITLHLPLTDATRNLINWDVLRKCKRGVRIINVSEGGLINERSLLHALECHKVRGAALDIHKHDPRESSKALISHDAVLASPHIGACTKETQIRAAETVAKQLVNMVQPKTFLLPLEEITNDLKTFKPFQY